MIYIALLSLIVHSTLQQYILTILNSLHLQFFAILKSNQMLVFAERGKPEYPEKNLSEQSREPTNSAHLWRRVRESNPGHISGRWALSPLRQPCSNNPCSLLAWLLFNQFCAQKLSDSMEKF